MIEPTDSGPNHMQQASVGHLLRVRDAAPDKRAGNSVTRGRLTCKSLALIDDATGLKTLSLITHSQLARSNPGQASRNTFHTPGVRRCAQILGHKVRHGHGSLASMGCVRHNSRLDLVDAADSGSDLRFLLALSQSFRAAVEHGSRHQSNHQGNGNNCDNK